MPELLLEPPVASEPPRDALAELRSTRDDFSQFFGDAFDQLQTLSLEMFARHKSLETAAHLSDAAPALDSGGVLPSQLKFEIERCLEELRRTHATLLAQGNHWQQTHADLGSARRQISDELAEVQAIRRQVGEMAGQFSEIKAELRQNHNALLGLSQRVERQLSLLETLTVNTHGGATAQGPPEQHLRAPVDSAAVGVVLAHADLVHQDILSRRAGPEERRE